MSTASARLGEGTDPSPLLLSGDSCQVSPSCRPGIETEEGASTAPRGPEWLQLILR